VERMTEVKTANQNAETEVKIWQWLLSLLQWYGAEGMSSDETSVEGLEVVYRVKILLWRRNIDKYLDLVDFERKQPVQALFSRSGAKPMKRTRAEGMPPPIANPSQGSQANYMTLCGFKNWTNTIAK
jgi:hypothetical protein